MVVECQEKVLFRHCDPAGTTFFLRHVEITDACVEHFFKDVLKWPFHEAPRVSGAPTAEIRTRLHELENTP